MVGARGEGEEGGPDPGIISDRVRHAGDGEDGQDGEDGDGSRAIFNHRSEEDIATRIHREIASGSYECMVCYGGLTRKAKIWSCKCCWAVYHLNCIQKWGKQGLSQESRAPVEIGRAHV